MIIIINVIESLATSIFVSCVLSYERKRKIVFILLLSMALFLCVSFFNSFAIYEKYYIFIYDATIILASIFYYKVQFKFLIFLPLLILVLSSLSTILAYIMFCLMYSTSIYQIIHSDYELIIYLSITKQIIFILFLYYSKTFVIKFRLFLKNINLLLITHLLLINIVLIVIENIIFTHSFIESELVLSILVIILISISTLILTYRTHQVKEKFIRSIAENESLSSQINFHRISGERNKEILTMIHDFKNSLILLNVLVNQERYTELKVALNKKIATIRDNEDNTINTDFSLINAVLNNKYFLAKSNNIELISDIQLSHLSKFHEEDLAIVLSNLLDNAMENCGNENQIFLKLKNIKSTLYVSVSNSVRSDFNILVDLKTTKKIGLHGFGIDSVKSTVSKYDGTISFTFVDELFCVKIIC